MISSLQVGFLNSIPLFSSGYSFSIFQLLVICFFLFFKRLFISKRYLYFTAPIFFIFIIGFAKGWASGEFGIDLFRDSVIVLNFILLLSLGGMLSDTSKESIDKGIFLLACLYSAYYLIKFMYYLMIGTPLIDFNVQEYRVLMGSGEFVVPLGLLIGFKLRKQSSFFGICLIILLLLVVILTQSRTSLLLLIIAGFIYIYTRVKVSWQILYVAVFILGFLAFSTIQNITMGGVDNSNLFLKLISSLGELKPANYDRNEVGYHWRGFENFLALQSYSSFDFFSKLFGGGFGYLLPLPFEMTLAGNVYDEIPFIHNGYMFLLLKVGGIGFLFYIFWLKQAYLIVNIDKTILLSSVFWFFVVATLVMGGPFEKNDMAIIVFYLGFNLARNLSRRSY